VESEITPGKLMFLNECDDQFSIKSNISTDLDPSRYQKKHIQKLGDVVKLAKGQFDEQLGRITTPQMSSFAASEFHDAISKTEGVHELIIDFWECTM